VLLSCTYVCAGSLGVNLHAANHVVLLDASLNPAHDLQAIYRVWRYGQTKPVYAYCLVAHRTMEEKIYVAGGLQVTINMKLSSMKTKTYKGSTRHGLVRVGGFEENI